ncbi:hypothetical protein CRM22_008792 [Opisthorchis felineus]|uniref:Uncharacterized protein n=1 Tax=Opisthorchis felineus TaxID=147828 RepID=A0A4S2L9R6_OPIFE|nr:hypothetical protein CRM22_008792 [Opisthorchis felineus]
MAAAFICWRCTDDILENSENHINNPHQQFLTRLMYSRPLKCEAGLIPLLHQRKPKAPELSYLNRRTCSRMSLEQHAGICPDLVDQEFPVRQPQGCLKPAEQHLIGFSLLNSPPVIYQFTRYIRPEHGLLEFLDRVILHNVKKRRKLGQR